MLLPQTIIFPVYQSRFKVSNVCFKKNNNSSKPQISKIPLEQAHSHIGSLEKPRFEGWNIIPVFQLQRGWRVITRGYVEKTRGDVDKLKQGRFHLCVRKTFFTVRIVTGTTSPGTWWSPHHWNISRCNLDNWRGRWIISSQLFYHERLGQMIFPGPFWPRLFYGSHFPEFLYCHFTLI